MDLSSSPSGRNHLSVRSAVKRAVLTSAVAVAQISGLGLIRNLSDRKGSLRVLMYHKVNDHSLNRIGVTVNSFRQQQIYLAQKYRVISLGDLLSFFHERRPLPPRAVLLTFDDGYMDNFTNAYPILKEFGHRAVMFVPVDLMGGCDLPHDRHHSGADPTATWEQLRAGGDVFDIGSHACTHRVLTDLDLGEARREILESKTILERKLEHEVVAFAYPKGIYTPQLESVVAEAGYQLCFDVVPRTNLDGTMHPLRIHRLNVEDYGISYFAALLDGSADILALQYTRGGFWAKKAVERVIKLCTIV